MSVRFPCVTPLVESFSELRVVTSYWGSAINVDVGRLRVHGICSCRMVHREVPEPCSNNKRFTSGDGKSCGIGTVSNGFEKGQVPFVSGSCSREREGKKGFEEA